MTIGNTTVSRRTFTMADGPTTFTISNLPRFSEEDLVVRRYVTSTGVTTDLEVGTDYTLTNLFPSNRDATLTLTTALTANQTLEVSFTTNPVQQAALRQASRNTPEAIEKALDRNTMAIKSIGEEVKRSIKLGPQFDGTVGQVEGEVQRTGSSIVVYDGVDNKLELVHRDAFKGNQSDIPVRLYHFRIKESLTDSQLLSSAQSVFLRIRNRITVTYDDTIRGHLRFGGLTSGRDVWYDANSFIALAPVDAINEGTVAVFTADNIVELEGDSSTGAVTATVDNSTWLGPIRHFVGPTGIQGREGPEGPAGRDGTDGADADTELVSRNAMNIGEIMAEIGGINASIAGNSNSIANANMRIGETTQDTGSGTIFQRIKTVRDHSASVRSDLGNKTDSSSARGIGQIAFHRLNKLEGDLGTTSDPDSSGGSAFARISNNVTTISAVSNRVTANQRAIANLPSGGSGGGSSTRGLLVIAINDGLPVFDSREALPDTMALTVRTDTNIHAPISIRIERAETRVITTSLGTNSGITAGVSTRLTFPLDSTSQTNINALIQANGGTAVLYVYGATASGDTPERKAGFAVYVKTSLASFIGPNHRNEILVNGLPSIMREMFRTVLSEMKRSYSHRYLQGNDDLAGPTKSSVTFTTGSTVTNHPFTLTQADWDTFLNGAYLRLYVAEGSRVATVNQAMLSLAIHFDFHYGPFINLNATNRDADGNVQAIGSIDGDVIAAEYTETTRNVARIIEMHLTTDPANRRINISSELLGGGGSVLYDNLLGVEIFTPSYSFATPLSFIVYSSSSLGTSANRVNGYSSLRPLSGFNFVRQFGNSRGITTNLGGNATQLTTNAGVGLVFLINKRTMVTISTISAIGQTRPETFVFTVFSSGGAERESTRVTIPTSGSGAVLTESFSKTVFDVNEGEFVGLQNDISNPAGVSFRIDFGTQSIPGYTDPT